MSNKYKLIMAMAMLTFLSTVATIGPLGVCVGG
jgi:hypothetical protein